MYGQSFIYIKFKIDSLNSILQQLYNMNPNIYLITKNPGMYKTKYKEVLIHDFGDNVYHYSKSHIVELDIYQMIADKLNTKCHVETWTRGRGKELQETDRVKKVEKLKADDHSKWAISDADSACKWIFIGDLNRMESQSKKGGGGILIIGNEKLWNAFNSLIHAS